VKFILIASGKIPSYLNYCINQIKKTQKKTLIYLLINKSSNYKNKNCKIVFIENLKKTKEHLLFIEKSKLAGDSYRNFFWRHSIERLYHINNFLIQKNQKNIIHIENDVLLFQNLKTVFDKIKKFNFACVRDSSTRVIGSFLFIKDKETSKKIVKISNNYLDLNDMRILNKIDKKIPRSLNLPIGENLNFIKKSKNFGLIKKIPYIFDAAAIGQFIDGPHRTKKISKFINFIKMFFKKRDGFINAETKLNISTWDIKWKNNKPYKISNGKFIPIANLHLHSKNLKKFVNRL